ncbi:DUF2752 domain-containing protein [Paenibacillus chartarius]|uniref:DUF2752 domain-containing protein n=1 Tax=Paenibacillus chartarius TaxID=747481 RepID=A0ABV6DKD9_9BACL
MLHEITGLYCPGCGVTRAVGALLELDVEQACRYNPLLFILLPLYAVYAALASRQLQRSSRILMLTMLILTIAFGVLRNVPAMAWLAPTDIW